MLNRLHSMKLHVVPSVIMLHYGPDSPPRRTEVRECPVLPLWSTLHVINYIFCENSQKIAKWALYSSVNFQCETVLFGQHGSCEKCDVIEDRRSLISSSDLLDTFDQRSTDDRAAMDDVEQYCTESAHTEICCRPQASTVLHGHVISA